jgi:tetratricopeptide (TPR) repeat protein
LGSQSIDILAGASDNTVRDSFVLPIAVDVIGVQPHAHYLAREIKGLARLPDGSTRWLIYIKDWDFRWQDVYRFREPVSLPAGTTMSMEFSYDNSSANIRNPHRPPRRVTFGQTSASEMGNLYIQVAATGAGDVALLERAFAPKILEGDIAGYQKMLEIDAGNAQLHADLGLVYVSAGRIAEAVAEFEESIRLAPERAAAHYALGTVLLEQRRLEPARTHFMEAVRLNPDFAAAYNNLGIVNHAEGRLPEAVASYSEALRVDGSDHRALYTRGRASAALGHYTEAITDYQASLRFSPNDSATIAGLASALASSGQVVAAIAQYRRALDIQPDERGALVDLAWLLATADPPMRVPDEAVRLARRAAELTNHQNAVVLETLAVATRAAGDLAAALRHLEAALTLARSQGPDDLVIRLETRLSAWRAPP